MIETFPFDAARYITTTEGAIELVNDALSSGNADYVANALGVIARARGIQIGGAVESGVCNMLGDARAEIDDIRLTTLLALTKSLGVTLTAHVEPM